MAAAPAQGESDLPLSMACVHRWHWSIRLNPDGTTTAVSPDGRKTLHSHSPPQVA